jgi:DNA-binding NarL/FixJ family response regulator
MLDDNIIEHLPEIRKHYPHIPILIYTMSPEEIYGKRMLDMGATGFLSKQSSEAEVIEALDLFLAGKTYISRELKERMSKDDIKFKSDSPIDSLSDRELIVMNYIMKGTGVKEISLKLDLKPTTVATYKARIFNKLGVSNVMDMRNVLDVYRYTSS